MTRVKVSGKLPGGRREFTVFAVLDASGVCVDAPDPLAACLGHTAGAMRTYFARQGWLATILVPRPGAGPAPIAYPDVPAEILAHPLVAAILAEFPGSGIVVHGAGARPADHPDVILIGMQAAGGDVGEGYRPPFLPGDDAPPYDPDELPDGYDP